MKVVGVLEEHFGKFKKNGKLPNGEPKYELISEGSLLDTFNDIVEDTRHEFEDYAENKLKKFLNELDRGGYHAADAAAALGVAVASGTGLATITVTTPLFGVPFLGAIGLTTSSALMTPLMATGIGAIVGAVLFGGFFYWKNNEAREKSLEALDKLSNQYCDNIEKMKFEAVKALEKRNHTVRDGIKSGEVRKIKI